MADIKAPNQTNLAKYKLVFLGDQSVGKTSIINRFIYGTFDGRDHVSEIYCNKKYFKDYLFFYP